MKKILLIVIAFIICASCRKQVVAKPDNLIPESQMVDIIYDLSLLEAIRTQRPMSLDRHNLDPRTYIYNKYKIDSVQFAQSNKFYAGDVGRYKRIYEAVDKRLETHKQRIDDQLKKSGQAPVSNSSDPVVR